MTADERLARLEERSNHIITKIDNIRDDTKQIFTKLDGLPCNGMIEKVKGLGSRVNYLYWVFVVVILGGIVFGIWLR